ncbi:hypothetical protein BT96DRAFT_936564 [Gymnopus androsaceus JB14]|uniref:Uncharacterized protein n=1 Tax=Gymnopus androsaceus JB14 TaxID=1447944 RepID=A0A6A4HVA8_9AGAR|nr:hypothetical protein BT96DRAFT_936564 [Gymnopus androsaceus JB14]
MMSLYFLTSSYLFFFILLDASNAHMPPKVIVIPKGPWGKVQNSIDTLLSVLSSNSTPEKEGVKLMLTFKATPAPSTLGFKTLSRLFRQTRFLNLINEHGRTEFLNLLFCIICAIHGRQAFAQMAHNDTLAAQWKELEVSLISGFLEYINNCSDFVSDPPEPKLEKADKDVELKVVLLLRKLALDRGARYQLACNVNLLGPKRLAEAMLRAKDPEILESLITLLEQIRDFNKAMSLKKIAKYTDLFGETVKPNRILYKRLEDKGIALVYTYKPPPRKSKSTQAPKEDEKAKSKPAPKTVEKRKAPEALLESKTSRPAKQQRLEAVSTAKAKQIKDLGVKPTMARSNFKATTQQEATSQRSDTNTTHTPAKIPQPSPSDTIKPEQTVEVENVLDASPLMPVILGPAISLVVPPYQALQPDTLGPALSVAPSPRAQEIIVPSSQASQDGLGSPISLSPIMVERFDSLKRSGFFSAPSLCFPMDVSL